MKLIKLSIAGILALSIAFTSCKPKDADVQAAVQQKEATGITVSVKEGVVTIFNQENPTGLTLDDKEIEFHSNLSDERTLGEKYLIYCKK